MAQSQQYNIPEEVKWFIVQKKKQENTKPKDIIKEVLKHYKRNIAYSTIRRIYAKYLRTGSVADRPRAGRPRLLSDRDKRTLVRTFMTNPGLSIKWYVLNRPENQRPVSGRTIGRALRGGRLIPKTTDRGKEILLRNK